MVSSACRKPLTRDRIYEQLGPQPPLVFTLSVGPVGPGAPCGSNVDLWDDEKVALRARWARLACVDGTNVVQLSPEGEKWSQGWRREGSGDHVLWLVPAGDFVADGDPEIYPSSSDSADVIAHGRWRLTSDGEALQAAGWAAASARIDLRGAFVLSHGQWNLLHMGGNSYHIN
jgi:hypothetical protein